MSEAFPSGENQPASEPDPADDQAGRDPFEIITEGVEPFTYTDETGEQVTEPHITPGQE